jgi:hypothetical protein
MKTFPEILHDVVLLLNEGRENVVIARGDHEPLDGRSSAYQLRFWPCNEGLSEYRCEDRGWLGGQWSRWSEHRGWSGGAGFDMLDVLATDWKIAS